MHRPVAPLIRPSRLSASLLALLLAGSGTAWAQAAPQLLFHVSADQGLQADTAAGDPVPNFVDKVKRVPDGAHGSAIGFLMDHRGLPYVEAIKELAQQVGMTVPDEARGDVEAASRARGLTDLLATAAEFYKRQLKGSPAAIPSSGARPKVSCMLSIRNMNTSAPDKTALRSAAFAPSKSAKPTSGIKRRAPSSKTLREYSSRNTPQKTTCSFCPAPSFFCAACMAR